MIYFSILAKIPFSFDYWSFIVSHRNNFICESSNFVLLSLGLFRLIWISCFSLYFTVNFFFFFLKNSWHFDWNCIDSTNLFGESWHINTESSTHEHRVFLHLFRFSVSSFVDCDVLSFKESVLYLCYIFNGTLVILPYYHFNVSRICHHFLFVFWYYISVFSHYSSSILLTVSQFLKTVFFFFFFLLKQHSDLLIFSLALWILCLVKTGPRLGDLWILEEGLYLSKSGICIPFDTSEDIHTLSISATSMRQTALLFKKITSSRGWLCFFILLTWGLVFWLLWPVERMHKLFRGY